MNFNLSLFLNMLLYCIAILFINIFSFLEKLSIIDLKIKSLSLNLFSLILIYLFNSLKKGKTNNLFEFYFQYYN